MFAGLFTPYRLVIANPAVVEASVSADAPASEIGSSSKEEQVAESSNVSRPQPDIESLIRQAFPECPDTMIAIARAESSMRVNAVHLNNNGTEDYGLFQINSIHGYDKEWLMNPVNNIRAAREVFEKQGLNAWVTYRYAVENDCPI